MLFHVKTPFTFPKAATHRSLRCTGFLSELLESKWTMLAYLRLIAAFEGSEKAAPQDAARPLFRRLRTKSRYAM